MAGLAAAYGRVPFLDASAATPGADVSYGAAGGASASYSMGLGDLQASLRAKGLHFTDRECACMFAGLDVNGDGVDDLVLGAPTAGWRCASHRPW